MLETFERAKELGFLGPEDLDVHLAHSLEFASCIEHFLKAAGSPLVEGASPRTFLDLGSGGGVPGLVLAELWHDSRAVLLDGNERKAAFLDAAVRGLRWDERVSVLRSRAEVAGRSVELRGRVQVVVARAFAAPPVTAECGAPFLEVGGLLVVSEPPVSAETSGPALGAQMSLEADEGRWPAAPLAELGLRPLGGWRRRFGFQALLQEQRCPERFPRREGIPTKRPLYQVSR